MNPVSRRTFLSSAALAAAGGLALRRAPAQPYRIGLESYTFHLVDFDTTVARTKELGLHYIELHDGHLPYDSGQDALQHAKRAFKDARIEPVGVYMHDIFTESEELARPIFQYATFMGFSYINGGPKREALPLLNRLVPEFNVQIAIHNHGPGARYESIKDVQSVLEKYPNISACVDIGHFARSHIDPVAALKALGPRAVAIHMKDIDAKGENTVVGQGTIDIPAVFAAMKQVKFKGLLVLEYEGEYDNWEAQHAGMVKSLETIHALIRRSS